MSAHKIQRQKIYFHFLNCENFCFVFVVVSINLAGVVVFRWIPLNGNSSVMMMNGSVLIIQHFTCYWTCFLFLKEFLLAKPCVNLNTCETILPTQSKHTIINTALNNSGHLKVHLNYCCFVSSPSFSIPIIFIFDRVGWKY